MNVKHCFYGCLVVVALFPLDTGLSEAQENQEVKVPPITGNNIELRPSTAPTNDQKIILYKDVGYANASIQVNQNTSQLPADFDRAASSLRVTNDPNKWTILWESKNYDTGDDQLWIQGSRSIPNLLQVKRPHGNNQWNDRISGVSFADALPDADDENRTICPAGGACTPQPNFQKHAAGGNTGQSAIRLRGGWYVRVCPQYMTAQSIRLEVGAAHNDDSHRPWFTWYNNSTEPVAFDFPIDLLYARDIWLKGTSEPWGAESRFCVGYANHFSKQYRFGHDEDHQPDQDDHDDCEC